MDWEYYIIGFLKKCLIENKDGVSFNKMYVILKQFVDKNFSEGKIAVIINSYINQLETKKILIEKHHSVGVNFKIKKNRLYSYERELKLKKIFTENEI